MSNKVKAWMRAAIKHEEPRWLSLLGTSGAGKTHCAKWLWREIVRREMHERRYVPEETHYSASIIHWPSLVDDLRDGQYGQYRDMIHWPFLVLDEIEADRDPSGFKADKLCTLLCSRVNKWTVITSNLRLAELEKIDVRLSSRVIRDRNLWIELDCEDYALRPKL